MVRPIFRRFALLLTLFLLPSLSHGQSGTPAVHPAAALCADTPLVRPILPAGVGAAAVGLRLSAILFEDNGNAVLILIPIGQVASAVGVERTVSRRRARKLDLALSGADRKAGLLLQVLP